MPRPRRVQLGWVVYLDVEAKLMLQPSLACTTPLRDTYRRGSGGTFRDTFRASDLDRGADYPVSLTRGRLPPLRLSRTRPIGIGRT